MCGPDNSEPSDMCFNRNFSDISFEVKEKTLLFPLESHIKFFLRPEALAPNCFVNVTGTKSNLTVANFSPQSKLIWDCATLLTHYKQGNSKR